jgi:hypothetical protein
VGKNIWARSMGEGQPVVDIRHEGPAGTIVERSHAGGAIVSNGQKTIVKRGIRQGFRDMQSSRRKLMAIPFCLFRYFSAAVLSPGFHWHSNPARSNLHCCCAFWVWLPCFCAMLKPFGA